MVAEISVMWSSDRNECNKNLSGKEEKSNFSMIPTKILCLNIVFLDLVGRYIPWRNSNVRKIIIS